MKRQSRHHLRKRLRTIVVDVRLRFGQFITVEFPAEFSAKRISRQAMAELVACQLRTELSRYQLAAIQAVEVMIYNESRIVGHFCPVIVGRRFQTICDIPVYREVCSNSLTA